MFEVNHKDKTGNSGMRGGGGDILSFLSATAVSQSNSGKMTRIGGFFGFAVDSDSEGNAGIFLQNKRSSEPRRLWAVPI